MWSFTACPSDTGLCGLTNYMEQSPSWEADSSSASQEITHLLCN
jgi:hypothetical protein